MDIGIIVYSHSGNTLSVAQRLEDALKSTGHSVRLVRLEPINEDSRSHASVQLKQNPDIMMYDAIVFASPVHAFSLAPVMKNFLSQVPDITGKPVYCFVTQHLKKKWLGGTRAVRQITAACKAKGADVRSSGIVNWSGSTREEQINDIIRKMSAI